MNDLIVNKIKAARIERGMTQKDLADHLGRTAAAISDLERGKVQINASDLYHLAQLLNKPIEYFYGEEFGGKDIQNLIAIIRKEPPETRSQSIDMITNLLNLQVMREKLEFNPEAKPSKEQIREFLSFVLPLSQSMNSFTAQLNNLINTFMAEIKTQEIDLSDLFPPGYQP
jgi:transcriptional regulator with XRE-family HTH domain